MADSTIKPDSGNDLVLQNNGGTGKIEVNDGAEVKVTTGSASGDDFTVNTSQLVVEGDTGNVGVGEASPTSNDGWGKALEITDASGVDLVLNHSDASATQGIAQVSFTRDSATLASVNGITGSTTSKGELHLRTHNGTSNATRLTVEEDGDVTIEDGDLVIGTAGHGIDFSGIGTSAKILDDYEIGNISGTDFKVDGSSITNMNTGSSKYIRVGNLVTINVYIGDSTVTLPTTGEFTMDLPFTSISNRNSISPVIMYIPHGTWDSDVTYPTGMVVSLKTTSTLAFFPTENWNNRLEVTNTGSGSGQLIISFSITYQTT